MLLSKQTSDLRPLGVTIKTDGNVVAVEDRVTEASVEQAGTEECERGTKQN